MPSASILHVEDDPNDLLFLQYAFKEVDIANAVYVAADGQTTVDYLAGTGAFADRNKYPLPCLVLLDLKLPGKSGMEVLAWIRAQLGLKVLVVICYSLCESVTKPASA